MGFPSSRSLESHSSTAFHIHSHTATPFSSGDDPSGADRDREVKGVISVLGYAVDRDLMLFGVLPYLEKRLEITEDGGRRARSARGVADLSC